MLASRLSRVPAAALLLLLSLAGCKEGDLCAPLAVSEDGTRCVCAGDLVETDDPFVCACPAGEVPSPADETRCLPADGGAPPMDAGRDAGTDAGPDAGPDACTPTTWYRDADEDGRGDPAETTTACTMPDGYVASADDCDDGCDTCWTGAPETCDTADNDCDGFTDEGVLEPIGDAIELTEAGGARAQLTTERVMVEPLEGGDFWLAWDSAPGLVYAVWDPEMMALTDPVVVGADFRPLGSRSLKTPDGRVALLWTNTAGDGDHLVLGQLFDAVTGSPVGPVRELSRQDLGLGVVTNLKAARMADGLAVAWEAVDDRIHVRPIPASLTFPLPTETFVLSEPDEAALVDVVELAGDRALVLGLFRTETDAELRARLVTPSGPEDDWTTVGTLETSTLGPSSALEATGTLHFLAPEQVTPGVDDDGFTLRDLIIPFDAAAASPLDPSGARTITLDPRPSVLFSAGAAVGGATPQLFIYRLTSLGSAVSSYTTGPAPTRTDIDASATFAAPTRLGTDHLVYLRGDLAAGPEAQVVMRRLGCPEP